MKQPAALRHLCIGFSVLLLGVLCLAETTGAKPSGQHYTGRVLYRANKAPVAGVLVEVVEAEDNGEPSDDVLGSARADADGRFSIVLAERTNEPVTLVVSAVRTTAETGGDKSESGIEVKAHRTRLGFLPHPSATKPNTLFIDRRRPGRSSDE